MAQEQQQGQGQQQEQEQSPVKKMQRALAQIRKVQHTMEMNYPGREDEIKMLREAGDIVWQEVQEKQKEQKQQQAENQQ